MTVREWYGRVAHDGRAVIAGSDEHPSVWLTKPVRTEDMYVLCFAERESVAFVNGGTPLEHAGIRRDLLASWRHRAERCA